jgi:uncharacterized protein (TIGR02246 family)
MENSTDAINTAIQKFMTAFRQGDADLLASIYTENARLLPPDSEMLTGRNAIKDFWRGAMDIGIKEATLETVEFEDGQNIVSEIGKYTLTIENEGERAESSGKYVVVWKKEGEDWKMHIDIWNANPID